MGRSKVKRARETRVAYRAKKTQPRSRRMGRARVVSRQPTAPVIPCEQRIGATPEQLMRWHVWLNEKEPEFEERYPGQFLAIWDEQVIAVGETWGETHKAAQGTRPDVIPLMTYIPRAEDVPFTLTPFPVEWMR